MSLTDRDKLVNEMMALGFAFDFSIAYAKALGDEDVQMQLDALWVQRHHHDLKRDVKIMGDSPWAMPNQDHGPDELRYRAGRMGGKTHAALRSFIGEIMGYDWSAEFPPHHEDCRCERDEGA